MSNENEVQIIEQTQLAIIKKAEIDTAISTAKQYPRSLTQFKDNALAYATSDHETAMECIYKRPIGGGENAEGLSVRMAEIVAATYGNIKVQARIIEQTDRKVTCEGIAHDLETNNLHSIMKSEITVTKQGKPYSEGMRNTVALACLAKAKRDAIFSVVPRSLVSHVEKAIKEMLFGNAQSLEQTRKQMKDWIKSLPIDGKRVWESLGIDGIDDMTPATVETIMGIWTGLNNSEFTLDDAFPEIKPTAQEALNDLI
jgi:hypothetical protein